MSRRCGAIDQDKQNAILEAALDVAGSARPSLAAITSTAPVSRQTAHKQFGAPGLKRAVLNWCRAAVRDPLVAAFALMRLPPGRLPLPDFRQGRVPFDLAQLSCRHHGQVERMNLTIKEATVKRFRYDSHDQLRMHLADFMAAYNFARRLKTLDGLTPYEYIAKKLGFRARAIHPRSDPQDAGTEHWNKANELFAAA
jgi:hypothetical protein